jgi:N-acyl-phosphatidylethanolamine-hydrolysing phospholipase D
MSLRTIVAAALAMLAACAVSGDRAAGMQPHHRSHGFQNNYLEFQPKGLTALWRWRTDAWRRGLPPPPQWPTPIVAADLPFIHANARAQAAMEPAVTWLGHATVLAQLGGLNLLTDPMFSQRASPLSFIGPQRAQPPGMALEELPHLDVVLISHNHYDHLDRASVRALGAQAGGAPLFIVPLGLKAWMHDAGITNVVELDWWQSHRLATVEVVMTPVQHWSGRGLTDRMATLWAGYAVLAPELHLFFAGDTAYSKDFTDIRERLADRQSSAAGGGFDVALLPVGAYEPRWFMQDQHVDPAQAVQIHRDLKAKRSIGVHWGTFGLTDEPLDEPPQRLAQARRDQGIVDDAFSVMAIGETRRLPRRTR